MKYKPYPKYKDSGIEWLGKIPEGWMIKRIDWCYKHNLKSIDTNEFRDFKVFHYSIPSVQSIRDGFYQNGNELESAKQLITKKTLLISKLNPRMKTIIIAYPREILTICSGEFVPLIGEDYDIEYGYFIFYSKKVSSFLSSIVQSVTKSHQRIKPMDIWQIW